MQKSWKYLLFFLLILALMTACSQVGVKEIRTEEDWKKEAEKFDNGKPEADYTGQKEMFGEGYVNEDEARNNGYVPVQEFKYTGEEVRNKKAKEVIDKDHERITKMAEKYLSKRYGMEMEVYLLTANYPYDAISVHYRTKNGPEIDTRVRLALNYNGNYAEEDFYDIAEDLIKSRIAEGIVTYAYQEKIKKLNQYILDKHPEYYNHMKSEYSFNQSPRINISIQSTYEDGYLDEKYEKIYNWYQENPNRSREEWIKLFDSEQLNYFVGIVVILKDKQNLPTEVKVEKLMKEVKEYPSRLSGVYRISIDSSWMWSIGGTEMLSIDSGEQKWYLGGKEY